MESNAAIGWEAPVRYYCRKCVPDGLREFYPPLTNDDNVEGLLSCDDCGEWLAPCGHEWTEWKPWFSGGEFRTCTKDGCDATENRDGRRS